MSALNWQKSSYSSESINCIYIAATPDRRIKVRESDDPDIVITTAPGILQSLLCAAKAGEFDHLAM
ncbi:DUF397 domain-containing protein [Kitasatospora sp. NPDC051170]|uniref:DUF397 domain-containing protein n=1 Tax=Kitasatospora sp. NPDC051170 TaxID=3364056 RepID=UPI0037A927D7